MNAGARRSAFLSSGGPHQELAQRERRGNPPAAEDGVRIRASGEVERRARVYIAAENRLLREALSRMLMRQGDIDVVGLNSAGPFRVEGLSGEKADILLVDRKRTR